MTLILAWPPAWFHQFMDYHSGWFLMGIILLVWFGTWRIRRRRNRNL